MNNNAKQFFDVVKNGDLIGFHYKKWDYIIAKTIDFFAYRFNPMKEKLIRIEHIGMIFDVVKDNHTITFSFGESLGSEGGKKVSRFAINKNDDEYLIDSKFLNKNIDYYVISCKEELSKNENIYARKFWNKKEEYSVINAMISPNWTQKLLKIFIKNRNLDNLDNFCSGEVNRFFFDIGRCDNCDLLPSPAEIINQSYVNKDKIFKL
jgi:hypothetical protein